MDAGIFAEFGMEGRSHYFSLPDRDWFAAFGGDYFDSGADAFYFGGADEDHFNRLVS